MQGDTAWTFLTKWLPKDATLRLLEKNYCDADSIACLRYEELQDLGLADPQIEHLHSLLTESMGLACSADWPEAQWHPELAEKGHFFSELEPERRDAFQEKMLQRSKRFRIT